MQALTLRCLLLNLLCLARHVPGVVNGVVDVLSHEQMKRFHQLALNADLQPVHFPWKLWSLGGWKYGEQMVCCWLWVPGRVIIRYCISLRGYEWRQGIGSSG